MTRNHRRTRMSAHQTPSNLPLLVCRALPEKVTLTPLGADMVPIQTLTVCLDAIRESWVLAQQYGCSTLTYDRHKNRFVSRVGVNHGGDYASEIRQGLENTQRRLEGSQIQDASLGWRGHISEFDYIDVGRPATKQWHWVSLFDPYYEKADGILSCGLDNAIQNYRNAQDYLTERIKRSYGRMLTAGGVDTSDVPLLREVQDMMVKQLSEGNDVFASDKSKLESAAISLADLDTAMLPLKEAIAHEAGIPAWVIFDLKTDNISQLDYRSNYLREQYMRFVLPQLASILETLGYYTYLKPPSFRDAEFESLVELQQADADYKRSAAQRNRALAAQVEIKNAETLKRIEKEGLYQVAITDQVKPDKSQDGQTDSQGISVGRSL
jgi:hypothetical protein